MRRRELPAYRPDIDGLRAVAVLAVLLYHARLGPFDGGFVGVDVFFVVSGFLITRLIAGEIDEGRFELLGFWERRARRLLPALAVLLATTTVLATALLLPDQLLAYGRSLAATFLSATNFLFWRETSYFNPRADTQPLLHLWSLAVEGQFYLLFPFLLILLRRLDRRWRSAATLLVLVASLVLAEILTRWQPSAAFFLAPTRAWEFLLGTLLALQVLPAPKRPILRDGAVALGLASILWAVISYDANTPFPGLAAVPPCLGAALVIYGGGAGPSRVGRILTWRPVVLVGLVSYSLYLWHWPLLVFARQYAIRPLTAFETVGVLLLSAVLAWLSWRFVERPFRGHPYLRERWRFLIGVGAAGAAALVCVAVIYFSRGLPGRLPPEALAFAGTQAWSEKQLACGNPDESTIRSGKLCRLGAPGPPSFVLWGDSLAMTLMQVVDRAAKSHGRAGLLAGRGACPPLLGVRRQWGGDLAAGCPDFNRTVLDGITGPDGPSIVILLGQWSLHTESTPVGLLGRGSSVLLEDSTGVASSPVASRQMFDAALERTVATLVSAGKVPVLLGPLPEVGWNVPTVLARAAWYGRQLDIAPSRAAVDARSANFRTVVADLAQRFPLRFVDLTDALCGPDACPVAADGQAFYSDAVHPTLLGADRLEPVLDTLFTSFDEADRLRQAGHAAEAAP